MQAHCSVAPPKGRRGLTFRVLVHLDIVESPLDEYGRSTTRKIPWRSGVIDGEHALRPCATEMTLRRQTPRLRTTETTSSVGDAAKTRAASSAVYPGRGRGTAQSPDMDAGTIARRQRAGTVIRVLLRPQDDAALPCPTPRAPGWFSATMTSPIKVCVCRNSTSTGTPTYPVAPRCPT